MLHAWGCRTLLARLSRATTSVEHRLTFSAWGVAGFLPIAVKGGSRRGEDRVVPRSRKGRGGHGGLAHVCEPAVGE